MDKNRSAVALLLCALLLQGCSPAPAIEVEETGESGQDSTAVVETTDDTETQADLYAALREVDAGGQTVTMLLREEFAYEFWAEEATGEAIQDTVYARDLATEELLNISLNYKTVPGSFSKQSQFIGAFTDSVLANDMSYSIVACAVNYMLPQTAKGYFRNLLSTPSLSMDMPWYAQKYIASMTVQDRLYLTAGSASMNLLENMCVLFFNKDLLADFGYALPYEQVCAGEWTFDALQALVKDAYVDTNGNGTVDTEDTLGYLTYGNMINAQTVSMGHAYIATDAQGIPRYTDTLSERSIDIYDRVAAFVNELDGTYFYNDTANDALTATENMLGIWRSGQVLFFPQVLSTAAKMREDEFDFGILPLPKYDTAQESYATFVLENVTVLGIPVYQTEPIAGQTLEALSIYGYTTLSPVYYDVVLKEKYSRDADTKTMLDLIREAVTFEYPLNTQFMANCIKNNSPLVSTFEKEQKSLANQFDAIVAGWLALEP